jgi:hydrogenase-4 component B
MTTFGGASEPSLALVLLVGAGGLLALSGVPGLLLGWRSAWGPRVATAAIVSASLAGIAGSLLLLSGAPGDAALGFASPFLGLRARLGADALSGWFAVPVFVVGGLGAIYGLAYWPARRHPRHGRRLRLCYGLLLASMVFILLAQDGATFLIAWEVMALTNYFLVATEEHDPAARRAGWIFLLYSHVTVLGLFCLFALERWLTGELGLAPISAELPSAARTALFLLALLAFGIKAGAMPVHSWLPPAHAAAPSHVSAVMSGVVIKMGIYGLVRTTGLFADPPLAWGVTVLALGAVAAFFGVVFALSQHDLKRLLAYHSIENIGIILLGLGLALVGRSTGRSDWVLLGMAGCLFHVWNHALFKSLLFFGAGSVVHATGTRDLERMGGLARRMPATALLFLAGSIAICGLPPGNGFVSELLVYLGFARAAIAPGTAWAALPAPVLAATGALAVACFVKVVGIVFLGTPRSAAAGEAHEAPAAMLAPMALLAALCALLGVAPVLVAPALERAATVWAGPPLSGREVPGPHLAALVPFGWVSGTAIALVVISGLLLLALLPVWRRGRLRQPSLPTWDCGYAASSPRLQYTGSSFAEIVTSRFAWVLRPREQRPVIDRLFPASASFHSQVDDTVLEHVLRPAGRVSYRVTAWFRSLPQGQLQRYILYMLAVLVPLLAWALSGGGPTP